MVTSQLLKYCAPSPKGKRAPVRDSGHSRYFEGRMERIPR